MATACLLSHCSAGWPGLASALPHAAIPTTCGLEWGGAPVAEAVLAQHQPAFLGIYASGQHALPHPKGGGPVPVHHEGMHDSQVGLRYELQTYH